ncbi:hypothetical protein FQA39_LY18707 [Lamprigera yunnana]|nr:hypothetical protein FQA39_LY18707 [Lamprigera yunnana]
MRYRFEETNETSPICEHNCVGGFSRLYTAINQELQKHPDAILLNAGDNFQGTFWYNFYKWNATQHFMNKLAIDAYTLGNHEFDDKVEGVIPFIKALKAPVVVANINDSLEPIFQGIYKKSIILYREGRKIGIVGVTLTRINTLSSTGQLIFLDEIESINKEAERLVLEENVDTVVVLSHCGYEMEKTFARKASPKISIIVGAHSHTLLLNEKTSLNGMKIGGPYPTVVTNEDGRKVLVVQAAAFTNILGSITLYFDKKGNVIFWKGDPIYLDKNIPQDPEINREIKIWRDNMEEISSTIVGYTDAMANHYLETTEKDAWAYASIALLNPGSLRMSISIGNITVKKLLEAIPFDNTVDVVEIKGKCIKDILELSTASYDIEGKMNFLSLSGIHLKLNLSKPNAPNIESIKVLCRKCEIPYYEPLKMEETYRIVLNSFLIQGGDDFYLFKKCFLNKVVGDNYPKVIKRYIQKQNPIIQGIDDRIQVVY